MGRQPKGGASLATHTDMHIGTHTLTSPRSRNGITANDETGVEAQGRSQRVEIPSHSQRHKGAKGAARVETGVHSM